MPRCKRQPLLWLLLATERHGDNHHYRVIQSLEFTTAPGRKFIDTLDGFRKKRNVCSYDVAGVVSDKEADEMFGLATSLRADVENWIRATHPKLLKSSYRAEWAWNTHQRVALLHQPFEEAQQEMSPQYWEYIERKVGTFERTWAGFNPRETKQ
jgi:hypothetical protein